MAQRVGLGEFGVGGQGIGDAHAAAPHNNVTADIVDRAVRATFGEAGLSAEVDKVMRDLMSTDANSVVARAYYHGRAAAGVERRSFGLTKPVVHVPYVLGESQAADLTEYAFDFQLKFMSRESHDHPMGAACRLIDRALVESRLPPAAAVSHVGAAVIPLIHSGLLGNGHHGCVPIVDRKDLARHVTVNLRARKLTVDASVSASVRASALGYLNKVESFVCDKRAQDCHYRTPVITSVHVYDVPMSDWAAIMDNKGARLLEGCMLFPEDMFRKAHGEMRVAGARYEVDAVGDEFRMGFVGSPSWWYQHKLSEYLRYGVDQVLRSKRHTYSYKVVERRGDTIFFRILRVSSAVQPVAEQHYRVPGVEMVSVNGFPVVSVGREPIVGHARRKYMFPRALWEDMLAYAKECVERNVLTPERLFNYYRTIAPRQSINAVVVSGGVEVPDLTHLVPLVTHVMLFAMLEARRVQLESRAQLESVMHDRDAMDETTFAKVIATFSDALVSSVGLTLIPLRWVSDLLAVSVESVAVIKDYDWAVHASVQRVPLDVVLPCCATSSSSDVADFTGHYRAAAPMDVVRTAVKGARTAQFLLDVMGDDLPHSLVEEARSTVASSTVKPVATVVSEPPGSTAAAAPSTAEVEVQRRRASILEAIAECNAEASKSEQACADQFRTLLVGSKPNAQRIADYKEMYHNPEFWYVSCGIVQHSFSGAPVEGFMHAAVYCPVPYAKTRLLQVSEDEFKGMSQGEYVERVYYKIANSEYTGWVYTNDSLLIYNGPAISEALEEALQLPLDFTVTLHQGPPGCGKTTKIVGMAELTDVVLVPVKKAARETAQRLAQRSGYEAFAKTNVRTVDSYLVNVLRSRKLRLLKPVRLLADEAFMTREGRWLAAAALLGVSVIEAFGDMMQIPHVPRAECPKNYVTLRHDKLVEEFVSYRCPKEMVACWNSVYSHTVRSASKVVGVVKRVADIGAQSVPDGCVMMGMYQADKKLLQEKYQRYGDKVKIMTVHESEGNTYRHVWLHRFDMRRRTDEFSLYDRQAYALVAMSRSTHTFLYVSPDLGDKVVDFIEKGSDVRRITAAADLASAGQSKEYG